MPEERNREELINISKLAEAEFNSPVAGPTLPLLRVGREPLDVRLFSLQSVEAEIHWCNVDGGWLTLSCNGKPCALCLARNSKTKVLLLPVLDAVAREVGLLPVPRDRRPGGLFDALRPYLKAKMGDKLLEISKTTSRRHQVVPLATDGDIDLGDDVVRAFLGRLEGMSGEDLAALYRGVYRSLTNAELLRDFSDLTTRIRHRHPDMDLEKL